MVLCRSAEWCPTEETFLLAYPVAGYGTAFMSRTSAFFAFLLLCFVILIDLHLLARTERRTRNLTELYERVVFSTSSFLRPDVRPELVFDRRLDTAFWDSVPASLQAPRVPEGLPPVFPGPEVLHFSLELSLSHFPDHPPRPNLLQRVYLWPGNQADAALFQEYARPKTVRLVFFRQKLVDVDRDFQFPGAPEFWAETHVLLEDRMGFQVVETDFLPAIGASEKFPVNIHMLWLRVEVLSYYPGKRYRDRVAFTEIDFQQTFPAHRNLDIVKSFPKN